MNRVTIGLAACVLIGCGGYAARLAAAPDPATKPATRPAAAVRFLGTQTDGARVIFVCDSTATMIGKMTGLKNELSKAVAGLDETRSFNIVFFYDGPKFLILDSKQLVPASTANKRKAYKFFEDVTSTGTTDPLPALEAAFKQRPDVVYFLSDGEFNNLRSYDEVTGAIKRLNAGGRARVNTILFEGFDEEAEQVLRNIAKANGGTYAYVKESDLVD